MQCVWRILSIMRHLGWCFCPGHLRMHEYLLPDLGILLLRDLQVKVKVAQSCPALCDPMDYTVHRILQARILEWVAFPFSGGSFQPRSQTGVSYIAGRQLSCHGKRESSKWGEVSGCFIIDCVLAPIPNVELHCLS